MPEHLPVACRWLKNLGRLAQTLQKDTCRAVRKGFDGDDWAHLRRKRHCLTAQGAAPLMHVVSARRWWR